MCYWIEEDQNVVKMPCSKKRKRLGQAGETLVRDHLRRQEWQILAQNWLDASHSFELDLVALDPNGFLVFMEVKTRSQFENSQSDNSAIESIFASVGRTKLNRLKLGARNFCSKHPDITHSGWRFDLAVVSFFPYTQAELPRCPIFDQKRHRLRIYPGILT